MNLSNRFDRGEHSDNSPDNEKILREYTWLTDKLRNYPIPEHDQEILVQQMEEEYQRLLSQSYIRNRIHWNKYLLRAAAVFLVFLTAIFLYNQFLFFSPIVNIEVVSISNEDNNSLSWWDTYRLHHGWPVTTPSEHEIRLHLQDSSTLLCSPNTEITLDYSRHRLIKLHQGEILVHAASIKNSTLIVQTPNLTTEVIGTVFRVKYSQ